MKNSISPMTSSAVDFLSNIDMYRVRLDLSYDGSLYKGWQIQAQGEKTVQGELKKVLDKIFQADVKLVGAGRTDAGVHAFHQVAHFDIKRDPSTMKLRQALQGNLHPSISVKNVYLAPPEFHANRSAERKHYRYLIRNAATPSALRWNQSYWIKRPLNIDHLNLQSKIIQGKQDFKSFQNAGTEMETTIRTVFSAHWQPRKKGWVEFHIEGDGFLKQMVRNIVGTLLKLESELSPPEKLLDIINAKDRRVAAKTAPPEGLYLMQIFYPNELDNKCRKI